MSIHAVSCRSCGHIGQVQDFTLSTEDVIVHDEGFSDTAGEVTTGQCDDCLKTYGPDDDCTVPEEDPRTAAEVNGETELELMREWSGK